jgi:hypothetical protein
MDSILLSQITRFGQIIPNEMLQVLVLVSISLVAVGFTGILYFRNRYFLQFIIGRVNPLIALAIVIFLGIVLLTFLLTRGWFVIYGQDTLKGMTVALILGSLLAIVAILVDLRVVFPQDMNVAFPESLLFYPAIGYFAEILFHVLPLTFLLILLTSLSKNLEFRSVVWVCILIVSLVEPIFQIIFGTSSQNPYWSRRFVGLHVFLISLLQPAVFKRYDFVSMYSFRLVYYLLWHIVWGHLRLRVLFKN